MIPRRSNWLNNLSQTILRSRFLVGMFLAASITVLIVQAQTQFTTPGKNLVVSGVPPIPSSIVREVEPYTGIYGLPLAGWNPTKREIWLKGMSSVTWVSRVTNPGARPETSSIYIQAPDIYDIYFQPQGEYLAYTRDTNGDEAFQLYLYDIKSNHSNLLSDGKSRSTEPVWSNASDKVVYSSSPLPTEGVNLRIVTASDPKTDRIFKNSTGGYLKAYDWSPDDKTILYCDFVSNTTSTLWLADSQTGESKVLSPKATRPELYDFPQFSNDGKYVYVVTDHDSNFRRLASINVSSGTITYLGSPAQWDVEEFQLAPNGKSIAFLTNEDGISKLHVLDITTKEELPISRPPAGVISDIKWRDDSTEFAFNIRSFAAPNDIYSIQLPTGQLVHWSASAMNGLDDSKFSKPELIHWKTFDGRTLSGFIYKPLTKFDSKRPVVIDIHGGPEEQFRPGFVYEDNYLLNDLGVAKIYPNVRGSSGYGRTFLDLDNGLSRTDAVKDIGALLDWIKTQPDLDSERVILQGASYGGYLALSTAYRYPDRIRGVIAESAITNLRSFVSNTPGWRRGLQRSEFGDEQLLKIKAFMDQTAPLNNSQTIKKPVLIIHGQNDPRVPVAEAYSLVRVLQRRVPVWYVLAKNEGHGFVHKDNRDYRFFATILFLKEYLLNSSTH
jgi:dipeptidyl aminopeptidase/acylaminoacyl peptidase